MRTDKELFQVVLDNFDLFTVGLCLLIWHIMGKGLIDKYEHNRLYDLIQAHPRHINFDTNKHWPYLWEEGRATPRKNWLIKQINKKP